MLRREVLRKQARYIVYYVHCYMAKEAEEGVRNVKQIQQRTAEATQTSVKTVSRITREVKANDKSKILKTPGKKRLKRKRVTGFDNSELGSIKRFVHTFHITHNEFPTVDKLIPELQSNFNFKGSANSVRRIVKGMGFRWKRTEDKNRILIEKSNIRLKRIEYLEQLKRFYDQGRTIVFSDELYLERTKDQKAVSKSQRVVVIHAGCEAGFIPNALLVAQSHDDYSNVKDEVYFDWLQHQLIPNLPPRSVVVLDTASPHDKEFDPAPNSYAKKCDMQAWLDQKGIDYAPDMYKPQLYQLIKDNKGSFKIRTLDKILRDHNHDILHIPLHHQDLNPIEKAWVAIKTHVKTAVKEFDVAKVIDLVKKKVDAIGPEEWKKMCTGVREIEDIYRNNEYVIDTLSDTISAGDMDSSSESEDSDDTSSSSDEDK